MTDPFITAYPLDKRTIDPLRGGSCQRTLTRLNASAVPQITEPLIR